MASLRTSTIPQQVAEHLRDELLKRRWEGLMPGRDRLATELGVSTRSIQEALKLLEKQGLLVPQGPGRRSRIVLPEKHNPPSLRIVILCYEKSDQRHHYMVELVHRLSQAGHVATFSTKSLCDLKMDPGRIETVVRAASADAWIVVAGSGAVLEWFAKQPAPALALAGRRRAIRIAGAGPDKIPAAKAALQRLIGLGHRRIVMLTREERRKPHPGLMERTFLDELKSSGITTGRYNLPDWDDSPQGLHRCLDSLFQQTPPTALVIDDVALFLAVERHLSRLGIHAPEQVSLVSLDPSPAFTWFCPSVAHVHWDSRPIVCRIVRWAKHVALGKDDFLQTFSKTEFIEGGTMGKVPQTPVQRAPQPFSRKF